MVTIVYKGETTISYNGESLDIVLANIFSQLAALKAHVDADVAKKADLEYLSTQLSTKANQEDVKAGLAQKVDRANLETEFAKKKDVEDEFSKRVHLEYLNTQLSKMVNRDDMQACLLQKADKAYVDTDFVKMSYLEAELPKKADLSYLNSQQALLVLKADKAYVDAELPKKADLEYLNSQLSRMANQDDVQAGLATKADKAYVESDFAQKAYVEAELPKKADMDHLNSQLSKTASQDDMQTGLAKKADKDYVDTDFAKKAYVDAELLKKADVTWVDAEFVRKSGLEEIKAKLSEEDSALAKLTAAQNAMSEQLSEKAMQAKKELDIVLKETFSFHSSSSELTQESNPIIKKVAAILNKYPDMIVCVEGHTGCHCIKHEGATPASKKVSESPAKRPKLDHCKAMKLSEDRAGSVVKALAAKGCKNSMKIKGFGCTQRLGMKVKIFPAAGQ